MIAPFHPKHWPIIGLLLGILFIGFAAIFTRLSECGPIASAFWRSAFALPLFIFMAIKESKQALFKPVHFNSVIKLLIVGMLFGLDIAIWNASFQFTSIANAGFLSNTTPLFMMLAAWIFTWHRLTLGIWLGLSGTLLGAALMTFGSETPEINWFGDSLAIFSAILFAAYIIYISQFRKTVNLWVILLLSDLGACIILALSSLVFNQSLVIPDLNSLFWLIVLSLISQTLGQGLVTTGLKYFTPSFSALLLTLTPVVCVVAAWFIFREPLSILQCLGMAFIIIGIYFSKRKYDKLLSAHAIIPTNGMIMLGIKRIAKQ
jgi:drug/metabolite transporter (DMT)-like permease